MDLNKLREQLKKSKPVRVTRAGRLRSGDDERDGDEKRAGTAGPSRLKQHTFADARRMAQERALMSGHTSARPCVIEDQLAFEEHVETDFGVPFHFLMTVPEAFPVLPPKVYCLSPAVPPTSDFHMYDDGALCLFLPAEWRTDLTLLDVRNWACEWAFNIVPRLRAGTAWMSPEHSA